MLYILGNITSHMFASHALDIQKVLTDARKKSVEGDSVLVHRHSSRHPCSLAPGASLKAHDIDRAKAPGMHSVFVNGQEKKL